jgi:HK97 family phage prohead protease
LDVRVVPYNVPTKVADPPDWMPYQEEFLPGAFQRQLTTPGRDRVWLNVEHEQGFRGAIGKSLKFRDAADGLHGSFGVLENADGDKALELVRTGFLTGISLEFDSVASRRHNGVVQRVRAQLDQVSLCRYPAYPGAEVLAMREEPEPGEPPPPAVEIARSSDVDDRLARLGFQPLGDALNPDELQAATTTLIRARRTPERAAEARTLIRHYNRAGLDAPASLRALARSM